MSNGLSEMLQWPKGPKVPKVMTENSFALTTTDTKAKLNCSVIATLNTLFGKYFARIWPE